MHLSLIHISVVFVEHKALYKVKCEVPEEPYECDYTCDIKRSGDDITIVSYSAMVDQSIKAAEELEKEGVKAEVIDIRTTEPFDSKTIIDSVKKTNKLVIVHEAVKKCGFGAEIAATVQEEAFDALKKPIMRVGAPFVPVPFGPNLEKCFVPNQNDILEAAHKIL